MKKLAQQQANDSSAEERNQIVTDVAATTVAAAQIALDNATTCKNTGDTGVGHTDGD